MPSQSEAIGVASQHGGPSPRSYLKRSASTNLAAYAVTIMTSLVVTPSLVRHLGDGRYGAWTFIGELLGYYGLMDLGVRAAVTYYVAAYSATHDSNRLKQATASAYWFLLAVGVILATLGITISLCAPEVLVGWQVDGREVARALALMSLTIGLSLSSEVVISVLVAHQRFDIVNLIDIVVRLAVSAGLYAVARAGGGLVELCLVQSAGKFVIWIAASRQAYRIDEDLSLHPRWFSKSYLQLLLSYGTKSLIIGIANTIIKRTDLLVVSTFLGFKAATYFTLGRMLVEYTAQANFNVTRAFTPHFTRLYARSELEEIKRLMFVGARYSGLLSGLIVAGLFAFGSAFLRLWVGPSYVSGHWTMRSDVVMTIMLLGHVPRFLYSIFWQYLFSSGNVGAAMWVSVIESVLHLSLTLALVKGYGLVGVAFGTLVSLIISYLVLMPIYMYKRLRITPIEFIVHGAGRALVIMVILIALTQIMVRVIVPDTWITLGAEILATSAVAVCLWYVIGLLPAERKTMIQQARALVF
jgi:O-antigen/teichoic acid export membrane protein